MKMMDIPWFYRKVGFVSYSVGQAMGAYSSFAMLAVFNHVCIAIAARRAGITTFFTDYCVLGDDVVIAHDGVADEYYKLLMYLGLDISAAKSIISNEFAEFAKRLIGPGINYTPLGAGVILQSLRERYAIGM